MADIKSEFWHYHWTGTVYELDLISIRKEVSKSEDLADGYVHQYSLKSKLRYLEEGSKGLINAMYRIKPADCKVIHRDFLEISELKTLIKKHIREQFKTDFKDVSFSVEFYERYVQILETRLNNKKRRSVYFPFLIGAFGILHLPTLGTSSPQMEDELGYLAFMGVMFLVFSLIFMPRDIKWIFKRAIELLGITLASFVLDIMIPAFVLQGIFCFFHWAYHAQNEAIFEE